MRFMSDIREWTQGKNHIETAFQQLFPNTLEDEKVDDVRELTEAYYKYKKEYVKLLSFTLEGENQSKYMNISDTILAITFSCCAGSCSTGDRVHLF